MINPPTTRSQPSVNQLLESLRDDSATSVERARQVYCNRDINFQDIEAIGFDMDYTLALYHQKAMESLSIQKTLERLVIHRGYPKSILDIERVPDFAIRGLAVDTARGNIFKLDSHRHVGKVYHGFNEVDANSIVEYRTQSMRLTKGRYALVDTLFALPEAFLYAALVDYWETTKNNIADHEWNRLYQDIRFAIDLAHRDNSIKQEVMSNTKDYIEYSADLALTLHKFRSAGKRLFLVTNSYMQYTERLMGFLLNDVLPEYSSWKHYFDIIITGAQKPYFFTNRAPFLKVDADGTVGEAEYNGFERGQAYQGGNLIDFERMAGCRGNDMLFIGDHIYGDIVRSKKSSAWRTVMVIQEMESELTRSHALREEIAHLDEIDLELKRINEELAFDRELCARLGLMIDALNEGRQIPVDIPCTPQTLRKARQTLRFSRDQMRRRRRSLLAEAIEVERRFETHFNPYWGLLFKMGNKNSIFGAQVEDYACLYTSRVSNFLNYSPLHYFRAPREPMSHERY